MKLSANLSREEFKCKCGQCDFDTVDKELVDVLQHIRTYFGKPLIITSGNRCPEYNEQIGGAKTSYHIRGRAADFYINGVDHKELQRYLLETYPNRYGIGCYDTFTHLDTRTGKGRW